MTQSIGPHAKTTQTQAPWTKNRMVGTLERLAPILLPLALFLVLQPETFGVTPNNLDPFFYTGFGINFDDSLAAGGSQHYFVSRWAVYYPLFIANALAGPVLGRLLLRLLIVSLILRGFWRLRPEWSTAQRVATGTLIVSLPMFLRALLTDYTEYAVASLIFGLVILAVRDQQSAPSALLAGVLTGLTIASNPIGVVAAAAPLVVFILNGSKGWTNKILHTAIIIATAVTVLSLGLFYFRWFYGIDNLYQPTIDFIQAGVGVDQLKSPRLDWLGFFTWLYAAPILLAVVLGLTLRRTVKFDRMEWAAFTICGAQYCLQWVDQFVRNGDGLEISYYWSMSYPSLAVAIALLIGRLTKGITIAQALGACISWCLLLVIGVPDLLRLPSGLGFALVATLVVGFIVALARSTPAASGGLLAVFVLWSQIGAPDYDPSSYHFFNASPLYDEMFWADGDTSEALYRETVWFENQMDTLTHDSQSFYVPVGSRSQASPILGIYQAHVAGRLLALDETLHIEPLSLQARRYSDLPLVTVLGPPGIIEQAIVNVTEQLEVTTSPIMDVTHDSDLGYRVVVFELGPFERFPESYEANFLPLLQGRYETSDVTVDPGSPAGLVTFGPYIPMEPGEYTATLHYAAAAASNENFGQFDVFTLEQGQLGLVDLPGTDGLASHVDIPFTVSDDSSRWEFRTFVSGTESGVLIIDKITIDTR